LCRRRFHVAFRTNQSNHRYVAIDEAGIDEAGKVLKMLGDALEILKNSKKKIADSCPLQKGQKKNVFFSQSTRSVACEISGKSESRKV